VKAHALETDFGRQKRSSLSFPNACPLINTWLALAAIGALVSYTVKAQPAATSSPFLTYLARSEGKQLKE
jgi:hypothetical protein